MRDYVALADELGIRGRRGGNFLYSRCPLHRDRQPSFTINVQIGYWKCFKPGCGEGIFPQLVAMLLGISLTEAELWVERRGRPADNSTLNKAIKQMLGQHDGAEPQEQVVDVDYFARLDRSVMPIEFLRRGFGWEICQRWDIRYDPVRERVVVPIFSAGEFVGWVARSMRPNSLLKFINSPGFPKTNYVYPLWPQDAAAGIVIVEGPLKAIWCREAGVPAATIFGSDLALEQIALLRRNGNVNLILGLDADVAGTTGTRIAVARLVQQGWLWDSIRIIQYPEGKKDANDCTFDELRDAYARARTVQPLDLMEA